MSRRRLPVVILAGLALLIAAGCGKQGGDSESSRNGEKSAAEAQTNRSSQQAPKGSNQTGGSQASQQPSAQSQPPAHHDSGGGAAQFRTRGGDNSIQGYGNEVESSEFEQAAAALHGYLDARAAHDWAGACSYMASGFASSLQQLVGAPAGESGGPGKARSCAQLLAALSAGLPPAVLREAAIADVGALRVEGDRALLLFHGSQSSDYFMPMAKESGRWQVAALAASALQ